MEAGDRARQGSYSPEEKRVLLGLMCQPPYLLEAVVLGEAGRVLLGKVAAQLRWK